MNVTVFVYKITKEKNAENHQLVLSRDQFGVSGSKTSVRMDCLICENGVDIIIKR